MLIWFYALVTTGSLVSVDSKAFGGPFEAIGHHPFLCEDEGTNEIHFHDIKARKISRTGVSFSGKVNASRDFDDELRVIMNFAAWGNGGWKPNFFILSLGPACSGAQKTAPRIFEQLAKEANVTSCPLPRGYYVLDSVPGIPHVNVTALPYNKYKVYVNVVQTDGTLVGCIGIHADIVPKGKNRGRG